MAKFTNLTVNDTGFIKLPSGTTAQRPSVATKGMIRFNTTLNRNEFYDGRGWFDISSNLDISITDGLSLYLDASNNRSYDSRENLVSYSTYNASTWSNIFPAGATITTGIDAPDGTNTAVRFSCNNTTNALLRVSFPAFTPNGSDVYTTSFYVRRISGTGNANTDLSDGVPSTNYSGQLVTNQWVRVVTTGTPTATAKSFIDLFSDQNTSLVLDFWGVQVEKNTTASSYVETNGFTISRSNIWNDLSGNGRNFTWVSTPSYTGGSEPYFSTLGNRCTGPASNSFGINNNSGYTIFLISRQNSLVATAAFKFYKNNLAGSSGRGIFTHATWVDDVVYFDQGGCCGSDTRTNVASGGSQTWNIWTFRRFTNSSTRTISKNGTTLITNTAAATTIDLDGRGVDLGSSDEYGANSSTWNARLGGFLVYNRGLSDGEITTVFNQLRGKWGI